MCTGAGLRAFVILVLAMTPVLSGCAAAPVAVAGAGSGISGISFISSTAYRSFTFSMDQVHTAALKALERMQITKIRDEKSGDDVKMKCRTKHLTINITLVPVTPVVTEASIKARKNWLVRDEALAAEILVQMDQILGYTNPAHSPL
jgi:hypothetical protein